MMRVYIAAAGAALVISVIVGVYLTGRESGTKAVEREQMKNEIETRDRVDEAISNPDDCHWSDRLRNAC